MTKLEFIDKINDILIGLNTAESDALGSLYDELMRSQWIPVEKELPPKSINDDGEECDISVDVFVTDGENIGATCYSHQQKRWWWRFDVTHWMLPILPGKED